MAQGTTALLFSVTPQQEIIPHEWDFSKMLYFVNRIFYLTIPKYHQCRNLWKRISESEWMQPLSHPPTPSLHHFLPWLLCLDVTSRPQGDESTAERRCICSVSACSGLLPNPNLSGRGRADWWATLLHTCCPISLPRRCFLSLSGPLVYWHHQLNATSAYYLFN